MAAWQGCATSTSAVHGCDSSKHNARRIVSYNKALQSAELRTNVKRPQEEGTGILLHLQSHAQATNAKDEDIVTPFLPSQHAERMQPCTQLITMRIGCKEPEVGSTTPSYTLVVPSRQLSCCMRRPTQHFIRCRPFKCHILT